MNTRDTQLLSCRPTIPGALITEGMSDQEHFQNSTLRPIAKLQNDLFVLVFKNYITKAQKCILQPNNRKQTIVHRQCGIT